MVQPQEMTYRNLTIRDLTSSHSKSLLGGDQKNHSDSNMQKGLGGR